MRIALLVAASVCIATSAAAEEASIASFNGFSVAILAPMVRINGMAPAPSKQITDLAKKACASNGKQAVFQSSVPISATEGRYFFACL